MCHKIVLWICMFDQGNGWGVELSGRYSVPVVTTLDLLLPPQTENETERLSQTWTPLFTRSLHFDFPSQDILPFHAEEGVTSSRYCNWPPAVCTCVCTASCRVCRVQCCVNLWTNSNNNLKIEKTVTMAKDTQPPLSVKMLAMPLTAG